MKASRVQLLFEVDVIFVFTAAGRVEVKKLETDNNAEMNSYICCHESVKVVATHF